VHDDWWKKSFVHLNVEEIEEYSQEWYRKLAYVQRSSHVNKHAGPMSFVTYMGQKLEKLKDFMQLITALKAKGLEKRHYL